jgi:hypothetical protein
MTCLGERPLTRLSHTPRINHGWSVYGAERSQPVATGRKWDRRESGSNRREPLPWVATGCRGNGKEGVDGSSPSEGFEFFPA